jgi:hypothetical protein
MKKTYEKTYEETCILQWGLHLYIYRKMLRNRLKTMPAVTTN